MSQKMTRMTMGLPTQKIEWGETEMLGVGKDLIGGTTV